MQLFMSIQCALPTMHRITKMDEPMTTPLENTITQEEIGTRPGATRKALAAVVNSLLSTLS